MVAEDVLLTVFFQRCVMSIQNDSQHKFTRMANQADRICDPILAKVKDAKLFLCLKVSSRVIVHYQ